MSGVRWLARAVSTNDEIRALAESGEPHGTTVATSHQTAGRGRLGRTWESPPGANLLFSVLVRRPWPASRAPLLCLGAAVATAQVAGAMYRIKWPNDVLAPDGRKVAGILAEAEWNRDGTLRFAILGIGLNVKASPDLPTAAHLEEVDGVVRDPRVLAEPLQRAVLEQVERVGHEPARVLEAWRRRSATLGRAVRIGEVVGTAVALDPDGALRVRMANGEERRVLAGDVEMVRCKAGGRR